MNSWVLSVATFVFSVLVALTMDGCQIQLPVTWFDKAVQRWSTKNKAQRCHSTCRLVVVETIPDNVTFGQSRLSGSTFQAWKTLIESAKHKIHIAAYKSSLTGENVDTGASRSPADISLGRQIYDLLVEAKRKKGVQIRMVENYPPKDRGDNEDGVSLEKQDVVERRTLNLAKIYGSGRMHSKFIVVDEASLYIGSANLDWRSLNQKMEIGILATDCPSLGKQLNHVFDSYWNLAAQAAKTNGSCDPHANSQQISSQPPSTPVDRFRPLPFCDDGIESSVFIATSPKQLSTPDDVWDLDAILSVISRAEKFIYIHVMDYIPMMLYSSPPYYWSKIDDALRAAIQRRVEVKILSAALHFVPENLHFLWSLEQLNRAVNHQPTMVKILTVPPFTQFQRRVARDRRTHKKFMVTENMLIIGTSNWSGDYFYNTTGLAVVIDESRQIRKPLVEQLQAIFTRDWASPYAHRLSEYMTVCLEHHGNSSICAAEKRQ